MDLTKVFIMAVLENLAFFMDIDSCHVKSV